MGEEATRFLEEQEEKLQEALAEQEKRKKAKKAKKDEEDIDPREFKYLPKELLLQMLQKRLAEDDCNAGAIFDSLTSQYWPDEKTAIELICDAVPQQKVEVVLFTFNKESMNEDGKEDDAADADTTEVCTNYRYARRHDPAHIPKEEEEKKNVRDQQESPLAKRPGKAAPNKRKAGAKEKKDPAQIEAEEKAAKEAEEERKLKEAEAARKKSEEAARAAYKPKDYTAEEKAEWAQRKADLEQFFSSIVMR